MGGMLVKSQAVFYLHLNGESVVDADVVVQAIHNMSVLTSEIAKEKDPLLLSRLQVKPFKNGSFEIVFITIAELGMSVLNNPDIASTIATSIVDIVIKCFEIKKLLKGEEPKSVTNIGNDQVKIENNEGQIIYAPNAASIVLNNGPAEKAVSSVAAYVMKNNPNAGFSLLKEGDICPVTFTSEDTKNIAQSTSIERVYDIRCTRSIELLLIKGLNLIGNSKWSFIYRKKTIHASINDEEWLDSVQTGEINIKAKDSIKVILETSIELNHGFPIQGTEKYSIIKVLELLSGQQAIQSANIKQLNLFDE